MCFTAAENSATPAKTSLMVSDPIFLPLKVSGIFTVARLLKRSVLV